MTPKATGRAAPLAAALALILLLAGAMHDRTAAQAATVRRSSIMGWRHQDHDRPSLVEGTPSST
jgi:hypothetical protein